jgi:hypothetical protein
VTGFQIANGSEAQRRSRLVRLRLSDVEEMADVVAGVEPVEDAAGDPAA